MNPARSINAPQAAVNAPQAAAAKPAALVLCHYLYPDDVISATMLTELATGLAERGWEVTASSGNRGCRDESLAYPLESEWQGVRFRRIWRPAWRQASGRGRILNALWILAGWCLLAFDRRIRADVVIVGTDPILSPLIALVWRMVRPHTRMVHWCFDLFPEAAIADGILNPGSRFVRLITRLLESAYRRCSLLVDIGPCMRDLMAGYGSKAETATIPPWALEEPRQPAAVDPEERKALFGDARIGLLYSGNFGKAHDWKGLPELADALEERGGKLAFSVRGNCVSDLKAALAARPVTFAEFASPEQLSRRLGAADIHIVSLRENWTGTVIPSKFFGSLAVGRPVLFIGSPDSGVAHWIRQHQVGWVLTPESLPGILADFEVLAASPRTREELFRRCFTVYQQEFSRERALGEWNQRLRQLVAEPVEAEVAVAAGRA